MMNAFKKVLPFILAITIILGSAYIGLSEVDLGGLFAVNTHAANLSNLTFSLGGNDDIYIITDCDEAASGSLTIPAKYNGIPVKIIDSFAFENCNKLTSVTFPATLEEICNNAFSGCTKLTSITIPDGIPHVSCDAFYNTGYYNNAINWKNNILYIGNYLIKVKGTLSGACTIKSGVKCIAAEAFSSNTTLTSVKFPDSVARIGAAAFSGCTKLTKVTFGNGLKSIGSEAFSNCTGLTALTIPGSLTQMDWYAFAHCKNLKTITFKNGAKCIGEEAFYECINLTAVSIPDSITTIDDGAFFGCKKLKSVDVPDGTYLGEGAFAACESLTSFVIPKGTTKIETWLFQGCTNLKSVTIPGSVKSIAFAAFDCPNLKYVFYSGSKTTWNAINVDIFNEQLKKAIIHYNATGHSNKTVTTKATLTKNGKAVTKCAVCGNVSKETVIYSPKTIKLSTATCTYNGKVKTPSVTVKDRKGNLLVNGTDYKITVPSGRKLPGIYKYTITFIGKYSGTKTLTFTILPKAPTTISATQTASTITLKWSESAGATGYKVYQYSSSQGKYVQIATVTGTTYKKTTNLKAGTTYKFKVKAHKKLSNGTVIDGVASSEYATSTKCAAPKISTITASAGQKATLKWSAVTGATGYQVYYSTNNSDYKKAVSTTSKSASKTFSKSAKGKKIYFKVRAYKKVNGQTIYGNWSAVKSKVIK